MVHRRRRERGRRSATSGTRWCHPHRGRRSQSRHALRRRFLGPAPAQSILTSQVVCASAGSDSRGYEVVLSLGAGVQSTTIALMSMRGELPAQFAPPTAAVFADTGYEPANVYSHLQWLIDTLSPKLPVHVVRAMRPDGSASAPTQAVGKRAVSISTHDRSMTKSHDCHTNLCQTQPCQTQP